MTKLQYQWPQGNGPKPERWDEMMAALQTANELEADERRLVAALMERRDRETIDAYQAHREREAARRAELEALYAASK